MADHDFLPVAGHPDDDECTHRADGTEASYCGEPRAWHDDHRDDWEPVGCDCAELCSMGPTCPAAVNVPGAGCWRTQPDGLAERVRALAEEWNATPDYTPSAYDQGRVDQRHDMTTELLALLGDAGEREGDGRG